MKNIQWEFFNMGEVLFFNKNIDNKRLPYRLLEILDVRYGDNLRKYKDDDAEVEFNQSDIPYFQGIYDTIKTDPIYRYGYEKDIDYFLSKIEEIIEKIKEDGSVKIWIL